MRDERWRIGRSAGDWIELGRNEIGDEAGLGKPGRSIERYGKAGRQEIGTTQERDNVY